VERQTVSGTVTASGQLELPPSAFPPGSYTVNDEEETAAGADNLLFSTVHPTSYEELGMLGGRFEYYTTRIPDGLFDVAYLGSYYAGPDQARAALEDVNGSAGLGSGVGCTYGERCVQYQIGIVFSDGVYLGYLRLVQESNALAEIITVVPAADVTQLSPQMATNLTWVTAAFLAATQPSATATATPSPIPTRTPTVTPTPVPTNTPTPTATATEIPTAFSILSARTEKAGSTPDTALKRAPLRRVRTGTRVYESVYVSVQSAPQGAAAQYSVQITSRGRQVLQRALTEPLDANPNTPFRVYVSFKPAHAGTYKVHWQVTVNGVTRTATASLVAHT
jgi:hypothetical protein